MMSLLVVMPTYNERANLERVVAGILAHAFTRVLVVDDGSPDGTGALADALAPQHPGRVEVMHRTGQRGLGRSYIDGLRYALTTSADAICQMDADLSHDPIYLADLARGLENFDLVIGSRYLHGVSVVNWPLHRIILSAFANRYIRMVTGLSPRDCTSAYRAWRRDALAKLPLAHARTSGYAFLPEMLVEADLDDKPAHGEDAERREEREALPARKRLANFVGEPNLDGGPFQAERFAVLADERPNARLERLAGPFGQEPARVVEGLDGAAHARGVRPEVAEERHRRLPYLERAARAFGGDGLDVGDGLPWLDDRRVLDAQRAQDPADRGFDLDAGLVGLEFGDELA